MSEVSDSGPHVADASAPTPFDPGGSQAGFPQVGEIVADKYRVTGFIGQGGMGLVAEAQHLKLGHKVAIKMLFPQVRSDEELTARFEREARAAARLSGPNVARILDVETLSDGSPCIVMERLEGCDLSEELERRGQLPSREAVDYVLEACAGMSEAHSLGIVHRDLKPSNLFLARTPQKAVKLLDFGISKLVDEPGKALTVTHSVFGTPMYMSPEQVRSMKDVDARSDVWSVGVILYECVTGRVPFDAPNAPATIAAIIADEPKPPRERVPTLSAGLERVIMKALEKDPKNRFQSMRELARALAPFGSGRVKVDDKGMVSTPPPPMEPMDRLAVANTVAVTARPRSRTGVWVIALGVSLVGGGLAVWLFGGTAPGGRDPAPGTAMTTDSDATRQAAASVEVRPDAPATSAVSVVEVTASSGEAPSAASASGAGGSEPPGTPRASASPAGGGSAPATPPPVTPPPATPPPATPPPPPPPPPKAPPLKAPPPPQNELPNRL